MTALGDRVTFTWTLSRRETRDNTGAYRKEWVTARYPGQPVPAVRTGILVGIRTLSNGTNTYNYEAPTEYTPTEHFTAYLIAHSLHRRPVLVLPEHCRPHELVPAPDPVHPDDIPLFT